MDTLKELIQRNAAWAERTAAEDPAFFKRLVSQQSPHYLWIGCSDSRVPANEIVDLDPGELFVHRNVANVVSHSDINAQSVIQFAVEALKVQHIMVVGHYRCSGVGACVHGREFGGAADYWLGHVRDVAARYRHLLDAEPTVYRRESLLCELNVMEQTLNACSSVPVLAAWRRQQPLTVHGWIYRLGDGRLRHLDLSVDCEMPVQVLRERAITRILSVRNEYYATR